MPSPIPQIGTRKDVPRPDLSSAARRPRFQKLLASLAAACEASPRPLRSEPGREELLAILRHSNAALQLSSSELAIDITGCSVFPVAYRRAEEIVDQFGRPALTAGASVIRSEDYLDNSPGDFVAAFPTSDKYKILAALQTGGWNYGIHTGDLIDWLRQTERADPFTLTGAGKSFLAGRFVKPVKDAAALAKRMSAFCPDIVTQGTRTVRRLAEELCKSQEIFLWWD